MKKTLLEQATRTEKIFKDLSKLKYRNISKIMEICQKYDMSFNYINTIMTKDFIFAN